MTETGGTPQTLSAGEPDSGEFDAETVPALARLLATRPYRPREDRLPAAFARLDYDGYRRVRFDPAQALWEGAGLPFQLQPNHRGFLFNQRVELFEVADGRAVPIRFQAGQFRYEGVAPPRPEEDLGFAGFRLLHPLNRPDHFDELCSFLGASYFRAVGRGNVYGISARGLALGTAEPSGEEFPGFSAFWIERPDPGAETITLHALMERWLGFSLQRSASNNWLACRLIRTSCRWCGLTQGGRSPTGVRPHHRRLPHAASACGRWSR